MFPGIYSMTYDHPEVFSFATYISQYLFSFWWSSLLIAKDLILNFVSGLRDLVTLSGNFNYQHPDI